MSKLVWDQLGERFYEFGVDKGVLYSPNSRVSGPNGTRPKGFTWNGLTSVDVAQENTSTTPLYFDGRKILDLVEPGDFAGSMKAITFPDEFIQYEGFDEFASGMYFDNQPKDTFGLSYRSRIGNDLDGDLGYKLHILYNLTASMDSYSYHTVGTNVDPIEFSWSLTSTPEIVTGYRPSAHVVLDSRKIHPLVLEAIEKDLYGSDISEPMLPHMDEVLSYVTITITDHEDGTWTATGPDYLIQMLDPITFQIEGANVIFVNDYTYSISST